LKLKLEPVLSWRPIDAEAKKMFDLICSRQTNNFSGRLGSISGKVFFFQITGISRRAHGDLHRFR